MDEPKSKHPLYRDGMSHADLIAVIEAANPMRSSTSEGATGVLIDYIFTFAPWDEDQIERGQAVREALARATKVIVDNVEPGPTRTVAIRKLIEARMDCNMAITFRGRY